PHRHRGDGLRVSGRAVRPVFANRRANIGATRFVAHRTIRREHCRPDPDRAWRGDYILALLRFRRTAREIDSPESLPGSGERLDVALAALLAILGTALFVYLSYTVISRV